MTWRLGVVGSPIVHSLSPQLHEAGLKLAGLEGASERVELGEGDAVALYAMMGERFDALSVTMPLKHVAATLCDSLDGAAARIEVVNSLLVRDGHLHGACTDGPGLLMSLGNEFGFAPRGQRVVVVGAGGAAREIVDALIEAGVSSVSILGRTPARVAELTDRYENVDDHADTGAEVGLVVNATPASRDTQDELVPGVTKDTIAVDVAYEPRLTPWRSLYDEAGCRTTNGLGMLAYQAALQMKWWWDVEIDGARLLEVIS
jgi:shikimate dehydrogenase